MHTTRPGTLLALLAAALAGGPGAPARAQTDPVLEQSRALAAEYQSRLRTQLVGALGRGGPLLALDVCKTAAPAIAEDIGTRTGARIWRTSLQTRNPRGTPDAWERTTLEAFAARRAAGEDPAKIEAFARTETGAARYMLAVPMAAEPCAQCHGGAVAPEVAAKIAELYPQDRATGFVPGTLRGAVSITWPAPLR
jgi:hypothetical protein